VCTTQLGQLRVRPIAPTVAIFAALENVQHGHAPCFDLKRGEWPKQALGAKAFVNVEGEEIDTFDEAVTYWEQTDRDVYVWWQSLTVLGEAKEEHERKEVLEEELVVRGGKRRKTGRRAESSEEDSEAFEDFEDFENFENFEDFEDFEDEDGADAEAEAEEKQPEPSSNRQERKKVNFFNILSHFIIIAPSQLHKLVSGSINWDRCGKRRYR
jgi:hypothetical protein